jgi:hypothetical protein
MGVNSEFTVADDLHSAFAFVPRPPEPPDRPPFPNSR